MIFLAIILVIIVLVVKVVFDKSQWEKNKNKVNKKSITKHGLEWLIMAAACSPSIIIFTKHLSLVWYYAASLSGLMIAFFLWLFIDGFYNISRHFWWWFNGSTGKTAAISNRFLQNIPLWLQILIKIGGLVTFITLYILKFK